MYKFGHWYTTVGGDKTTNPRRNEVPLYFKHLKNVCMSKDRVKPHAGNRLWKASVTSELLKEFMLLIYRECLQIDKKTNIPAEKQTKGDEGEVHGRGNKRDPGFHYEPENTLSSGPCWETFIHPSGRQKLKIMR